MVKKVAIIYFFLFSFLSFKDLKANDGDLVRNLNQELLIFDQDQNALVPILDRLKSYNVVYLNISASDILNHKINIVSKKEFYIYLNDKVVAHFPKGTAWFEPRKYISNQFANDHIFLAFYAKDAINTLNINLFRIKHAESVDESIKSDHNFDNLILKQIATRKDKYIVGVILSILIFIALKTLFPSIFLRIFKLQVDLGSLVNRSSSKLAYFQNESAFIFLFISILTGIYMFVFLEKETYVSGMKIFENKSALGLFIYGVLGTFLLFFAKYIVYTIMSYVFGVGTFSKILINEFSKTIFQTIVFIYPIYFIVFSPYFHLQDYTMLKFVYPLVLVLCIYILKELYYFYHLFNSNKFYIIAYICICDLFPTCVFLKILSQSEFI